MNDELRMMNCAHPLAAKHCGASRARAVHANACLNYRGNATLTPGCVRVALTGLFALYERREQETKVRASLSIR